MKKATLAVLLAGLALTAPALADDNHHAGGSAAQAAAPAAVDGVVRKVDKVAQKITIRHGPIPALDMPEPMTMVYRVKDPALLGKVKAGDKVKFEAEIVDGNFVLTTIAPAN